MAIADERADLPLQVMSHFFLGLAYVYACRFRESIELLRWNIDRLQGEAIYERFGEPGLPACSLGATSCERSPNSASSPRGWHEATRRFGYRSRPTSRFRSRAHSKAWGTWRLARRDSPAIMLLGWYRSASSASFT